MRKNIIHITENDLKKIINKSVKTLMENYSLNNTDELMEFLWLKPNKTGLNVDIFVDDGGSYIRNNHQLLLFARNGYDKTVSEFITFAVSENPIILNPEIEYHITYNDIFAIQTFIYTNLNILKYLANEMIDHKTFINTIKIPNYSINENKQVLNEMATLRASDSGLPMDIWLDEGATFQGHAPRLKFKASFDQHTTREFSSMLLTNPPTIENMPKNSVLKNKDIKKLERFVINNIEQLLKLANGEIDYINDFLPNIIK